MGHARKWDAGVKFLVVAGTRTTHLNTRTLQFKMSGRSPIVLVAKGFRFTPEVVLTSR